jgi:hypothetical protein
MISPSMTIDHQFAFVAVLSAVDVRVSDFLVPSESEAAASDDA